MKLFTEATNVLIVELQNRKLGVYFFHVYDDRVIG